MTTKTKPPTKLKSKSTQTFIRLNVDAKLDNLLKKYEKQYHLLNRGDVVRMLLSEVDYIKSQPKSTAKNFFDSLESGDKDINELEALEIANQLLDR
jgi:hypothetical protein